MSGVVIDTCVWVEYFRCRELPAVDRALQDGVVLLPLVVASELLSGVRNTKERTDFLDFLETLQPIGADFSHWCRVGDLRLLCRKSGITLSTPDAHVAQCAIDAKAGLLSFDRIFQKLPKVCGLQILE